MEQQPKEEKTIIGLHRPFNKPLKSLVWVCRYANHYRRSKNHDFNVDFYLWILKSVDQHSIEFDDEKNDGIIRPQKARTIRSLFANCKYQEIKTWIRNVLLERITNEDKLIYSSYKNTSYYITLAKKLHLVDNMWRLNSIGEELAKIRDYHFFELSDKQRILIFNALCPDFFEPLMIIGQSGRLIRVNSNLETPFFRTYLKAHNKDGGIRFITSFDKNYLDVLRAWVNQLQMCTYSGSTRKMYLVAIKELGLEKQYDQIIRDTDRFYEEEYKNRVKLEQRYDKIRMAYDKLYAKGQSEFGYVNLYDIKKSFRLSYESFNELLNSYYTACRHIEIILFSNTVSSIDMRRRFLVAGNVALKIRIIKKS